MKNRLFKIGAAAAITVTGLGAVTSLKKPVAASTFKTAIKRVKINYLPGKGVRIWTNYNAGRFMGFRAKDGTEWNVVKTAVDKSGNLWYMVGDNEWIQARYTVDVDTSQNTQATTSTVKKTKTVKKSKISNLAKKAKDKVTAVTNTQKKQEKEQAKIEKKKANVKQAKQIVEQTINKNTSSQAPDKVNGIVALAKSEIGKPYVWGAVGPDSFDCSGLVQYIYEKYGVNMPRTTYDQVKVGQTVSMDSLQPGDLLFWGSTTAPYHVAIYIGNNQYVNSATPEQGTILQTISSYYYPTIAKRVL
ncbi:C40 family peptidase [Lactobacillus hamsteri]|uniref:Cell wall-associated hydrolase n=1 Tax=Lactobacillus hamsteri DSM 5661 = JCM 6256 TaxID=1423754 RepID=A0A0R1YD84_9LACO|nr:C40 family peptidase [Lactobacillus hamsteri]KRM40333.1 cell wall-associated hydrolase [Lactobacillus hamsteri DSM 5661 = JCM 6256]